MKNIIQTLIKGNNLTYEETKNTFELMLDGKLTKEESLSFLSFLNNKKATIEELAAEVDAISSHIPVSKTALPHRTTGKIGISRTNSLNF